MITVTSVANTTPTISASTAEALPMTVGDPAGMPAARTVTIGDAESAPSALTTTVSSSNAMIATGTTTGTGSVRGVTVTPVGVGYATLTVTVSDGDLTASATLPVAVSGPLPTGTLNLYGASDASTAVDLGNGTMAVGDDENNTLRVYARDGSGYPVATLDVRAAGLALRDSDPTREIDIEASATKAGVTFWLGSHGQNKAAKTRLNRQELFTTTASGSTLTLGGSYQHLRDDMVAWDDANGARLGLAAAALRAPEGDGLGGPTGFNIEGAEFSPDGSTLYTGFRGPLTSDGKAIVVPITNPDALVTANPTTSASAAFGTPLTWDLAGRGIREMRRSNDGTYLLIAGPSGVGGTTFALYRWDANPANAPLPLSGDLTSFASHGSPEGIVDVPSPLVASSSAQLITDSGDQDWYGDGQAAKALDLGVRKATSARVVVGNPPACSTSPVTIGSVQGTGETSPVAGSTVTVRGTVIGDYEGPSPALRGVYVQDGGDGNATTSDGIFVFEGNTDRGLYLGDVVQVTGAVSEFQGQTQIGITTLEACGPGATVTPTDVTLPSSSATALERYEGMLVRFPQPLTVTEHFQLGRFGQVVLAANGKLRQPTADYRPGPQAAALQAANDLNRIIVDDASQFQNPDPIVFGRGGQPLSATNTLRGGDTTTNAVGVLTYTWAGNAASPNAYRLRPVEALGGMISFDPTDPRPTAPPAVGTGGIRVASANLLNFFNTYTGCTGGVAGAPIDCRGAENDTEYQRQLAKEVSSLRFLNADVIGVMELENDGYGPTSAEQALVNALNAVDGAGAWAFVDADAGTGVTDVAGSDAIKVAILYRTAAVTPVATFVDQAPGAFERRPVAETFTTTSSGARFTVVANHFKSKGSCPTGGVEADQGDGQGCWNARRTAQATELAGWVRDVVVPGAADPDVLILGDLNSYAQEDPIVALKAAGYTNLSAPDAYSYVFNGQWGYLDYVLASASLAPQVTGASDAHHNADEPSVLDYNTNFKSPAQVASLYAADRFRTSDHDPVLVGLNLGPSPLTSITVTPANPTVAKGTTQQFTATGTYFDGSTADITLSVTWSSSSTSTATISSTGLATAVAASGTSTISATQGAVVGSTVLTAAPATLSSIAVTPANPTVAKGTSQQFAATGTYSDASTADITSSVMWSSSSTATATIGTAGSATAVAASGTSTISATQGAVVGSTVLTAAPATLTSIAVTPANSTVPKGATRQFTATGTYSDGSTADVTASVTWASSSSGVTISSGGLATAVAVNGTSTISATSGSVVGSTVLTAAPAALMSIAVTPASPTIKKNAKQQFSPTGTYSDGTTARLSGAVTWSSSNAGVATITSGGLATGQDRGTTAIVATSGSISGSTTLNVTQGNK